MSLILIGIGVLVIVGLGLALYFTGTFGGGGADQKKLDELHLELDGLWEVEFTVADLGAPDTENDATKRKARARIDTLTAEIKKVLDRHPKWPLYGPNPSKKVLDQKQRLDDLQANLRRGR